MALLLTGPPGVGKTTICKKVRDILRQRGVALDGFITEEVRESGQRVAFEMVSLDEAHRGLLACTDPKSNGPKVGKYTVCMEEWEPIALPILEKALSTPAEGSTPCGALILDEIGKMECFSDEFVQQMRRLLTEPPVPILVTVAQKSDIPFIKEAKSIRGVQMEEATRDNRDKLAEELADRLMQIKATPDAAGEDAAAAPVAKASKTSCSVVAAFDKPSGKFSEIFLQNPPGVFGSVNAGDYELYVGGGGINRPFAEALEAAGHERGQEGRQRNVVRGFIDLHRRGLEQAVEQPGQLVTIEHPDSLASGVQGFYAFCHSELRELSPVGFVGLSIFKEGLRPKGNDQNACMVYVVGPNCLMRSKKIESWGPNEFLRVLQLLGAAIARALTLYNSQVAEPRLDVVRMCLVSGEKYKHPDTTKLQVATALAFGLRAGAEAACPRIDFAYDEGVFEQAWQILEEAGDGDLDAALATAATARAAPAASSRGGGDRGGGGRWGRDWGGGDGGGGGRWGYDRGGGDGGGGGRGGYDRGGSDSAAGGRWGGDRGGDGGGGGRWGGERGGDGGGGGRWGGERGGDSGGGGRWGGGDRKGGKGSKAGKGSKGGKGSNGGNGWSWSGHQRDGGQGYGGKDGW